MFHLKVSIQLSGVYIITQYLMALKQQWFIIFHNSVGWLGNSSTGLPGLTYMLHSAGGAGEGGEQYQLGDELSRRWQYLYSHGALGTPESRHCLLRRYCHWPWGHRTPRAFCKRTWHLFLLVTALSYAHSMGDAQLTQLALVQGCIHMAHKGVGPGLTDVTQCGDCINDPQ